LTCFILIQRFEPVAHDYVVKALHERYKGDVELGNLQISLFPAVHATGENLIVHVPGRPALPPLVDIRHFTLEAHFISFFRNPKRIGRVRIEGLRIQIPPKEQRPASGGSSENTKVPFVLEEVIADGTQLEILPHDAAKDPLVFNIHQLTLRSVGIGRPMTFHAELDNAKPPGFIHSDGDFGPWNQDDPGETPVKGRYTFSNADLSVFKGISGTLSSSGSYNGKLEGIEVEGTTDVPDFALASVGHPEHLVTRFQATVDGTSGDTNLHPVTALLGKSSFEVAGPIERNALLKGKEINLTAKATGTGLSDFLRLAVKSPQPPMRGTIRFDTTVKIPPGQTHVLDRLNLNGRFALSNVTFTSPDVQAKIASLSHHAEGDPKNTETTDVSARFAGRFLMHAGTLTLPMLEFDVPGAKVTMDGHYQVASGDIDFKGTALLEATISEMTTGVKHVFLKAVDPLFKREGSGAVLPIRISGTRGKPSFKLDIGRALTRRD
jgi:hypothetical protein